MLLPCPETICCLSLSSKPSSQMESQVETPSPSSGGRFCAADRLAMDRTAGDLMGLDLDAKLDHLENYPQTIYAPSQLLRICAGAVSVTATGASAPVSAASEGSLFHDLLGARPAHVVQAEHALSLLGVDHQTAGNVAVAAPANDSALWTGSNPRSSIWAPDNYAKTRPARLSLRLPVNERLTESEPPSPKSHRGPMNATLSAPTQDEFCSFSAQWPPHESYELNHQQQQHQPQQPQHGHRLPDAEGAAVAGDNAQSGSASAESKPAPPWSQLKTKAGKLRRRLPLACFACRQKKVRCSGETPACKHCLRWHTECVYKTRTQKSTSRRGSKAAPETSQQRMECHGSQDNVSTDAALPSPASATSASHGTPLRKKRSTQETSHSNDQDRLIKRESLGGGEGGGVGGVGGANVGSSGGSGATGDGEGGNANASSATSRLREYEPVRPRLALDTNQQASADSEDPLAKSPFEGPTLNFLNGRSLPLLSASDLSRRTRCALSACGLLSSGKYAELTAGVIPGMRTWILW
jgi:hypothetical protein